MVDRIHRSRGRVAEDLLDLRTGRHVAPQHLDCQLLRGLIERLEGALGDALFCGHYGQNALDAWSDLLQELEPLAREGARVDRDASQVVLRRSIAGDQARA